MYQRKENERMERKKEESKQRVKLLETHSDILRFILEHVSVLSGSLFSLTGDLCCNDSLNLKSDYRRDLQQSLACDQDVRHLCKGTYTMSSLRTDEDSILDWKLNSRWWYI